MNVENTTSSDFRITATARYLAFDAVGSGSELRLDGTIGSDPTLAVELYRPVGPTPLFVAPYAGVGSVTFNVIDNDAVIARYRQTLSRVGLNVGVNLGARSDLRVGAYIGHTTASIKVGDPGFPELRGKETGAEIVWRLDTQDSPVVPTGGMLSQVRLSHMFNGPDITMQEETFDFGDSLTQLSAVANRFWSVGPRNRVFVYGGFGTSFDDAPLPTNQFALGAPFRLGAYSAGRVERASLLRRDRWLPAASRPAAGLHGRTGLRGRLARKRRRLRRMVAGRLANERWRRTRDGHARGAGHGRRFVGLRRTLAHVPGCGTDLSLRLRRIPNVGIWPSFCYLGRRSKATRGLMNA